MTKKLPPHIHQLLKTLELSPDVSPGLSEWQHFLAEIGEQTENHIHSNGSTGESHQEGYSDIQALLDSPLIQKKIEARIEEKTKGLKENLSNSQTYMNALPDMIINVDSQGHIIGFKGFKFLSDQPESITLLGAKLETLWPEMTAISLKSAIKETIKKQHLTTLHVPPPSQLPDVDATNLEVRVSPVDDETALLILRMVAPKQPSIPTDTLPNIKTVSPLKPITQSSTKALDNSRLSLEELLNLGSLLGPNNTSARDTSAYYEHVVETIHTTFGFYHTQLLQPTESGEELILVAAVGKAGEQLLLDGFRVQLNEGAAGAATKTGQSQLCDDIEPSWKNIPQLPEAKSQLAIPVLSKDKLLGVIDIYSDQTLESLSGEITAFNSIVGQIAIAAELFEARREISLAQRESSRLQQVITREGWQAYRGSDGLKGFWYDETKAIPIEDNQIERNASNGDDVVRVESSMPAVQMTSTIGQLVTRPIEVRGQLIGTLGIQDNASQPLSSEEIRLLDEISVQVSNALDNARLITQTQKRAVELQTVADLSASASTILQQETLLKEVVDLTKQRFSLYHTNLYLLEEDQRTLNLVAASGDIGEKLVEEGWTIDVFTQSSLAGAVVRSRAGVITEDVLDDPNFLQNPYLPNTRSELSVPMIASDKVVGVLSLQSDIPGAFSNEDKQIHLTLATQIAIALQNAKLYEEQLQTAEQLRELDQLKTQFLANMSHELRTPLNSIIGFADVLLEGIDGDLNDRMIEDVTLIRDGGRHLRNLIGDILDQAKIEAGMMELSYSVVQIERIANEVIAQISSMARTKPIEIVLELENAPEQIEADRTRLIQILFNLLSNAVKFTDEGQITINMYTQGEYLVTHVKDTGSGISKEDLPIIFEQFQQVGTMQNRKEGGTGLGLPISKNLVELHGGEISVESEPDIGTTFSFTIPLTRPIQPKKPEVD
ncbi:MAG: ATP-binding protein [Anaerolineae bacterium]